jgi:hypothetical protein
MVKFHQKTSILSFINPSTHPLPHTSLPKLLFILSPSMDPFNALSNAAATRKIPSLRDAPPAKVMSCALVASTDLERALDAVKEVTGGAGAPSTKMANLSVNSPGRPAMVCGHSAPCDEDQPSPACQGSACTRGHGTCLARALSPHPMIGKEHRSVMPTHPTTVILTPRKVTIRRQRVVPSSSSDDDLSLVKHDSRVDLNPGSVRIRYTQEPPFMWDLPPSSPPAYIVSGQWVGVGHSKVLIPNPEYKGKGRTESALSNLTLRVQRRRPSAKIRGSPRTMEFTDDDMEEELSNELVASLKQKITALEEQLTNLHLAVYDQ